MTLTYSEIEEAAVGTFINGMGYGAGYDACYGCINGTWYAAAWYVPEKKTAGLVECEDEDEATRIAHAMASGNSEYFFD